MVGISTAISQVTGLTAKYLGDTAESEKKKLDEQQGDKQAKGLSTLSQEEYNQALYSNFIQAIKSDVTGAFVAKAASDSTPEQATIAKAKGDTGAERTTTDADADAAAKLASDAWGKAPGAQAQDPDKVKPEDLSGSPILKDAEGNSIGSRNSLYNLQNGTKEQKEQIAKSIKEKGALVVGQDIVAGGHLKMHDFTSLKNKPEKEGDPDPGTYGKSGLKANEFVEGMAKLGFITKDAGQFDGIMKGTQDALADKLKDTKLGTDGDSLSLLYANLSTHKGKDDKGVQQYGFASKEDIAKLDTNSKGFAMLKEAQALEGNKELQHVDKDKASAKAHEVNSKSFENYSGKSAEGSKDDLAKLGIKSTQMDQFSGAAYSQGLKDFSKLSDPKFIAEVKAEMAKNPNMAINIGLSVGSTYEKGANDYADVSRGHDLATLSQLNEDRGGVQANGLNQLALVAHGQDGMQANLDAITAFQKATGAQVNLDLGMYSHSNGKGEMVLGSNTDQNATLDAAGATKVMDQVQAIVGEIGSANIAAWGCFTGKEGTGVANAMFNSEASNNIGSLTVTGTNGIAYSSAENLTSSDSNLVVKKDENGQLMTERVTTNGIQGDTHTQTKAHESYTKAYEANNGTTLAGQQFSKESADKAKETNDKISGLQGSNRAENDKENGEGSVADLKAGDVAEAKQEVAQKETKEEDQSSES